MRVLVIAPHADDETIGMGGTIAKHCAAGDTVSVAVMTGHGEEKPHPLWPRHVWDTVRAEARQAMDVLNVDSLHFEEIPAVEIPDLSPWALNSVTRRVIEKFQPEVLYVPFPFDLHLDHRALFHSFSVHWRAYLPTGHCIKQVYCYEVASETHLNIPYAEAGFLPNRHVDISGYLDTKMDALACYESQIQPHPAARSLEALRALAVWRGSQIGVAAAEAFVLVRALD